MCKNGAREHLTDTLAGTCRGAQSRGGNCGGKDNKHVHSMLRADNEHEECALQPKHSSI